MKIENIAIIGMGALGTMYGSFLTRRLGRDAVGFIMDPDRRARYEADPVTDNGEPCDFRLLDAGRADRPADLVIFAVKATGLDRAMDDAAAWIGPDTVLISLLNGITSEALLEHRFGAAGVVYCVAQGMDATKLGSALTWTRMGTLVFGIPDGTRRPALEALTALAAQTGLPCTVEEDVLHRLWSKFMLNVGVNQVVMVCRGTYGTIQAPGAPRERMIAAMREVISLAECEGIPVTEDDLRFYVDLVDTLSPDGMPSMRQDGAAGRPSEVELFSGTVCRLAAKHGLPVPVNEALYREIRAMEAGYGV